MNLKNKIKVKIVEWFSRGVMESVLSGKENIRFKIAKREVRKIMAENDGKKWWASKTIWVNFLTVVAGALTFLMSPEAKMDAQQAGTLATVLGVVNMLLRLVTDKAVSK